MGIVLLIALASALIGYVGTVHHRFPFGIHPLAYEAVTVCLASFAFGRMGAWLLFFIILLGFGLAVVVDPYLWKAQGYFQGITREVRSLSLKINFGLGAVGAVCFLCGCWL